VHHYRQRLKPKDWEFPVEEVIPGV